MEKNGIWGSILKYVKVHFLEIVVFGQNCQNKIGK